MSLKPDQITGRHLLPASRVGRGSSACLEEYREDRNFLEASEAVARSEASYEPRCDSVEGQKR